MSRSRRWKVIVCGTKFGRVYMSALACPEFNMDLSGILAGGSERSKECARRFGVPLYTDVSQLPDDIDAACVVISSEMGGGKGTELALKLLEKGIPVLQEHPMHHDELVKALLAARRFGVVHKMNTLYPYVDPVRQFLVAGKALLRDQKPIYIDGACSIQLKTSFFDIIGRLLGRLRPWEFQALESKHLAVEASMPFRSIQGVIGGVSVTIRLQNQLHYMDPDNHSHLYHHLTLGTAAGSLSLVDTHGPVIWRPRPHIPTSIQNDQAPEVCADEALDFRTVTTVVEPAITWREAMVSEWPRAVRLALIELQQNVCGESVRPNSQYYLSLMQMIHEFDTLVGPPEVLYEDTPEPQSGRLLMQAISESEIM